MTGLCLIAEAVQKICAMSNIFFATIFLKPFLQGVSQTA